MIPITGDLDEILRGELIVGHEQGSGKKKWVSERKKLWGHQAVEEKILQLDDANFSYFCMLVQKKFLLSHSSSHSQHSHLENFILYDRGMETCESKLLVYPTAVAPKELLQEIPVTNYDQLESCSSECYEVAKTCSIWFRPMQAGTGSTVERNIFIEQLREKVSQFPPEVQKKIQSVQAGKGSKGTDLFFPLPRRDGSVWLGLAELQILRTLKNSQSKIFKQVFFEDLVSEETIKAVEKIWHWPCFLNSNLSYLQWAQRNEGIERMIPTEQAFFPTFTSEGIFSLNRLVPGGHAFFAIDTLKKACEKWSLLRSKSSSSPLVAVVGNGEDLGCRPDPVMVGWMVKNKIPIVMVTTDKTEIDLKGGQIAVVPGSETGPFLTIIEEAQAVQSGQADLFRQLGLRQGDEKVYFNTNMALFNFEVLSPLLEKFYGDVGEEEFLRSLLPNLVENWKEQVDLDGIKRKYLQLEGAMGSVLLNLDKIWRERYKQPLVHFINIPKQMRTKFFSPIKTSFDFFMQFFSDRFFFDEEKLELINLRPGALPFIQLNDPYYKEVQNVIDAFSGSSLLNLDSLHVKGKVHFFQTGLEGTVEINNKSSKQISLNEIEIQELEHTPAKIAGQSYQQKLLLNNLSLEIDASGERRSLKKGG